MLPPLPSPASSLSACLDPAELPSQRAVLRGPQHHSHPHPPARGSAEDYFQQALTHTHAQRRVMLLPFDKFNHVGFARFNNLFPIIPNKELFKRPYTLCIGMKINKDEFYPLLLLFSS